MKDFFIALLETGCRPGELRTRQWSEVRGDDFVVLAHNAKDRDEREIPIEPRLAAVLAQRRTGPDGQDLPADAHVFGDDTGRMLSRRTVCERWQDTCARAGIKYLQMRDLRREFASQLAESKVPLHEVRDALGHSSTTMTNTYFGIGAQALRRAYKQRTADRARQGIKRVG